MDDTEIKRAVSHFFKTKARAIAVQARLERARHKLNKVLPSTADATQLAVFGLNLENLGLSTKLRNVLFREHRILYVAELVQKSSAELLLCTPGVGLESMNEIEDALARHGLKLGMTLTNWPPPGLGLEANGD